MAGVDRPLSSSRVTADNYDAALTYYHDRGMTDGLPIVPPTGERVSRLIAGSGMPPERVIGVIPPVFGPATIEKIAVNAVMAGCLPEHMPAVVTAIEAILEPRFDLNAVQTTTNPVSIGIMLNGPVRQQLAINCSSGCFGPGSRANMAIGRAVRLILLNLGGAAVGDVDKATQGAPGKLALCFGENEEESPWSPLHVERGFDVSQSTVTVFAPQSTINVTVFDRYIVDELSAITSSLNDPATNHYSTFGGDLFIAFNPVHARGLHRAGYEKDDLKRYFHDRCRYPVEELPLTTRERRLQQPTSVEKGMAPMLRRWQDYSVVVAGGSGGLHSTLFPGFGTRSVTHAIKPPPK